MPVTFPFAGTRPLFAGLRVVARGRNVPTGINSSVGTSFTIPDTTTAGSALAVLSLAGTSNGTGTWSLSGGTWAARASLSASTGVTTVNVVLGNVTGLTAGSSGTITARYVGETVDLTLTLTVTMQSATTGTLLTPTLYNTSTSASTLAWRPIGLAFDPGEVPSGSIPKCRVAGGADVDMPFFDLRRYADGSLWSCQAYILDDTSIAAGTSNSRDYEIYAAAGTQATGTINPATWLQAQSNALTTDLTNQSVNDGTGNVALPNKSYSLKVAAADTNRFEVRASTKRLGRFRARQTPAGEEHMVGTWYGDLIQDAAGTAVRALRVAPVRALPYVPNNPAGVTQTRGMRTYDSVTKWGATTLRTQTAVQQSCHTWVPDLRDAADNHNAAPLWINVDGNTPLPTTRIGWRPADWDKFARANMIPAPPDWTQSPAGITYPTLHVTGRTVDNSSPIKHNGHRIGINGVSGYEGRGLEPDYIARAIYRQGATDWLVARVTSAAVYSMSIHVRDHRIVGSVESYGLIPFPFRKQGPQSYPGLGDEVVSVQGQSASPGWTITFPGGAGPFYSYDSAHAVNISGFMAWFEARDDFADAALSAHDYQCRWGNYNELGADSGLMFATTAYDVRRPGIPTWASGEKWGAVPSYQTQERTWGPNLFAAARNVMADSDRHAPYLDMQAKNLAEWLATSISYFPASQKAKGQLWTLYPQWCGNWMADFTAISFYRLSKTYRDSAYIGFKQAAEQAALTALNVAKYAPAALDEYRHVVAESFDWTAEYLPPQETYVLYDYSSISGNVLTVSTTPGLEPQPGDKVRFCGEDTGLAHMKPPIPVGPAGEDYNGVGLYVRTFSGNALTLSTDPAGTNQVMFADRTNKGGVGICCTKFGAYTKASGIGHTINQDDYGPIKNTVLQMAWINEHPALSAADFQAWQNFYDLPTTTYSAWTYDATRLRPIP